MLSIVIPAYNEESNIQLILLDLFQQDLSIKSYEVIVVDNGSLDCTKEIVWNFFHKYPWLPLRLIHENRKGVSIAKNAGAMHCKFDYIMFLDSDNRIEKSFLRKIKCYIEITGCSASTLKTLPDFFTIRGNIFFHFLEFIKILNLRPFGKILISKSIFLNIGGFNKSIVLGENVDLLVRAKKYIQLNGLIFSHFNHSTILCSLRRFNKQGFLPIIIPWFFAYLGYYKLNYLTIDLLDEIQIKSAPPKKPRL